MRAFKSDLLNHFKALGPALQAAGATAALNPLDFHLEVRFGAKTVTLLPQFIEFRDGQKRYTPQFSQRVTTFIGWLPYFNRQWELSTRKLKFKQYVMQHDLLTPQYSQDTACNLEDVIVKRSMSTFGAAIKGPYRTAGQHKLDTATGEYYEQYIPGRIAKIWFWNGKPVCLEFQEHARIKGDGVSTIEALALARLEHGGRKKKTIPTHPCLDLLAYQGCALKSIPARGEEVVMDFRYGSPFQAASTEDVNLADKKLPEFDRLGRLLLVAIPEGARENCAFTVDAVVDEKDRVWVLEMNSNPFIHPLVYPAMLRGLAGIGVNQGVENHEVRAIALGTANKGAVVVTD